ncbi:solute carrier organic anion transporter family member 74D-like isoform X1 [Daphnia carinata]|uniref:solute carrier organic anion transporter family member 74D-like isoform X1 n=2 Tax=Daphnia carinata TaxID=120202 RepID=UPI00257F93F7|nr:solute carrier organic anion transporter family member 74D-like isoform X1 [Daphnia carinata]
MQDRQHDLSSASLARLNQEKNSNLEGNKCGLCNFYPTWLQRFANPRSFLVCFCIKNVLQGMIFTYIIGIETSIERHFQFDGKTIGMLLTLGEVGPVITAVWISHLGSRGNKPLWMGMGMLLIAVSLFFCFTMYLLFPPPPSLISSEINSHLSAHGSQKAETFCRSNVTQNATAFDDTLCTINPVTRRWAFAAWVFIYSLMGIGATTIYVIGAPYLDDSIPNNDSPFYFAITIAVRIIGPVFGYLLSSFCLKFYVDIGKRPGWKSDDPRWIGAWWLGALILAVLIALFALILASFPRVMKRNDAAGNMSSYAVGDMTTSSTATLELREHQNPNVSSYTNGNRLAEFKQALRRLLRNPILLCSCGSSIFTILGLAGYFVWLPKYFEHEFRLSKSNAAMYSGLSGNVTMIFGVLLSGYLMKKYHPSSGQVAAIVAVSKYVYAFGLLLIMLLSDCNFMSDLPGSLQMNGSLKLDTECNDSCNCGTVQFLPICFRGTSHQQTYFSPCYAGCREVSSFNGSVDYGSCMCDSVSLATPGYCMETCSNVYVYMVLLAVIKLVVSVGAVGNLIIDLRCVEERDKALALGFLATMSGLLGFLPNPIIYGSLIDSSCLAWEASCGERGSCWVYNTDEFRYKLHGLTSACLMIAGAFEVLTYFKVKGLLLFKNKNSES